MTEYGLLGPVQAVRDGHPLVLGGPRQRAVLARLLLARGRAVPAGTLADDVWGGRPPPSAAKTLQKYVSELRAVLGPDELVTVGRGYRVRGESDATRFEQLLAEGDADRALELWGGEPLGNLPDVPFVAAERARLEELRLVAVERRADDDIRAGRHAEVVAVLAGLATLHPGREHLTYLLMLALYRSGRQVEALEAFRRHRQRLAGELGIEPAEELLALERAILRHDGGLAPTSDRPRGNVRVPVSTFVGRAEELRRTLEALRAPGPVTLTGPGGVGKTRLAMEAAVAATAGFPGGVWLVDLAGLRDPRLVVHQVARTLAIGDPADADEEGAVVSALCHREPLLLVLDNCEHLVARCAAFADRVVRSCPGTRILATSRQPLGVDGEHVLVLAPLDESAAGTLFEERARHAGATADDVAGLRVGEICRALDGLPLAVELAAGQLRALGPVELTARLDARLQFSNRRFDAPARQRTLWDMVAWSYSLLPPATRRFFARLSVFASTSSLDGPAAVCGSDDVAAHLCVLVDHSLLVRSTEAGDGVRFRMLDTLRLFGLEQLAASGEEEDARRAHAGFYLDLLDRAGRGLRGPDQAREIDRIGREEPNIHAALEWAARHDPALGVRLSVALWPYCDLRWRERFAIAYLSTLLDEHGSTLTAEQRAWALTVMADLAANPGESRISRRPAEEAVELFRTLGDDRGLCSALVALACAHRDEGTLDAADRLLAEARDLARAAGHEFLLARVTSTAWAVAQRRGRYDRAEQLGREEVVRFAALGDRRGEVTALRHVAVSLWAQGELDGATELCERVLASWIEIGEPAAVAHAQTTLADITRVRGDHDRAVAIYEGALAALRAVGDRRCTASTFKNLAVIATARGEHDRATALLRDAIGLRYELGDYAGLAELFTALADILAAQGRCSEADVLLAAAEQRRTASGAAASSEELAAVRRVQERRETAPAGPPRPRTASVSEIVGLDLPLGEAATR